MEDVKILEDFIEAYKIAEEVLDGEVIQAIENLIARNKELEQWYELFNKTNPEKMKIIADSFHEKMADKFDKEKIEELKNQPHYNWIGTEWSESEVVGLLEDFLD